MPYHRGMRQLCLGIPILAAIILGDISMGQKLVFTHDGADRHYRIHLPTGLPEDAPLVVVLHGYGGSGFHMQEGYGWPALAEEEGFAVIFPDGTLDQWNRRFWQVGYDLHVEFEVDDVEFLVQLAAAMQIEHGLDPLRTFVTGLSNGGDMSYQLACRRSEFFAGFAPVAGTMMNDLYVECDPGDPRPLLAVNGTDDEITLFKGDMDNRDGYGAYRPVPEVIELWARILEVPILDLTILPDEAPHDGSAIRFERHRSNAHSCELWFYRLLGGGHDWPGRSGNMDIDTTRKIWDFFSTIDRESPSNPADLNRDGFINAVDLGILHAGWGTGGWAGDLDENGDTDGADLELLLSAWTG